MLWYGCHKVLGRKKEEQEQNGTTTTLQPDQILYVCMYVCMLYETVYTCYDAYEEKYWFAVSVNSGGIIEQNTVEMSFQ